MTQTSFKIHNHELWVGNTFYMYLPFDAIERQAILRQLASECIANLDKPEDFLDEQKTTYASKDTIATYFTMED